MGMWFKMPWVSVRYTMGREFDRGSEYYRQGVRYTMGKGFYLPWVGVRYAIGRGIDIPWVEG